MSADLEKGRRREAGCGAWRSRLLAHLQQMLSPWGKRSSWVKKKAPSERGPLRSLQGGQAEKCLGRWSPLVRAAGEQTAAIGMKTLREAKLRPGDGWGGGWTGV